MLEPKIEFIWDTVVAQIEGDGIVKQLRLKKAKDATISTLQLEGVFVAAGAEPNTGYLRGVLPLGEGGYIITNELMETEVPGILAAGDGATAALSAERFLSLP